jgi:hypothetical protein
MQCGHSQNYDCANGNGFHRKFPFPAAGAEDATAII